MPINREHRAAAGTFSFHSLSGQVAERHDFFMRFRDLPRGES
jgi:hypothetical protein